MKTLFTKSQVENLLPQKEPFAMVETLLEKENELFSTLMISADNLLVEQGCFSEAGLRPTMIPSSTVQLPPGVVCQPVRLWPSKRGSKSPAANNVEATGRTTAKNTHRGTIVISQPLPPQPPPPPCGSPAGYRDLRPLPVLRWRQPNWPMRALP